MPLSLAEEARLVVGIDPAERFQDAGVKLARERALRNLQFALADGMYLPFADGTFDLVLSHAVIEHVADAPLYLRECARVLAPGGRIYLSTAPYLSFAGAHLPRLKIQIPLHLIAGRRIAFSTFQFLARYAPWTLKEPANENSFIKAARRGEHKHDDLLEIVREELHATSTVRKMPGPVARWLRRSPLTQNALISTMEYVLAKAGA
jgi:SAM-dependent methyltransferase